MELENSVIKCDSVYKIFGSNPEKMLEGNLGNVDTKKFQEKGLKSNYIILRYSELTRFVKLNFDSLFFNNLLPFSNRTPLFFFRF